MSTRARRPAEFLIFVAWPSPLTSQSHSSRIVYAVRTQFARQGKRRQMGLCTRGSGSSSLVMRLLPFRRSPQEAWYRLYHVPSPIGSVRDPAICLSCFPADKQGSRNRDWTILAGETAAVRRPRPRVRTFSESAKALGQIRGNVTSVHDSVEGGGRFASGPNRDRLQASNRAT